VPRPQENPKNSIVVIHPVFHRFRQKRTACFRHSHLLIPTVLIWMPVAGGKRLASRPETILTSRLAGNNQEFGHDDHQNIHARGRGALSLGVGAAEAQNFAPSGTEGAYFSGQAHTAPAMGNRSCTQVPSGSSHVEPMQAPIGDTLPFSTCAVSTTRQTILRCRGRPQSEKTPRPLSTGDEDC